MEQNLLSLCLHYLENNFFFSFQITRYTECAMRIFNCCSQIILTFKIVSRKMMVSIHPRVEYSENRARRRVSTLQNDTRDTYDIFSRDLNAVKKFAKSGNTLLSFPRWNARASHERSWTSREAHATVSKSMRGRRRDPHPLFRHRHHHHRYHPRRLLSLFGNLSSNSVQLSSVAPLGRCGSRIVASSQKFSSCARNSNTVSLFSKFDYHSLIIAFIFVFLFFLKPSFFPRNIYEVCVLRKGKRKKKCCKPSMFLLAEIHNRHKVNR